MCRTDSSEVLQHNRSLQSNHSPFRYSRISPGWQSNILHNSSKTEMRMVFDFPVFRMERLDGVMPIFLASSPNDIFRRDITLFKFTTIIFTILNFSTVEMRPIVISTAMG